MKLRYPEGSINNILDNPRRSRFRVRRWSWRLSLFRRSAPAIIGCLILFSLILTALKALSR